MSNLQKIKESVNSVYTALLKYEAALSSVQEQIGDLIEDQLKVKQAKHAAKTSSDDMKKLEGEQSKELVEGFKKIIDESRTASFKELLRCYKYWSRQLMPLIKKIGYSTFLKLDLSVQDLLCKLSSLLLLHGDYYKAIDCLYDLVVLYPSYTDGRSALIRWLMYLGEWELLEEIQANEKKIVSKVKHGATDSRIANLIDISEEFLDFNRKEPSRAKHAEELLCFRDQAAKVVSNNTFQCTEFYAVTHYVCAFLSRVPKFVENTPDPLHLLQLSYYKYETIMRNRVPGLAKDQCRIGMVRLCSCPKKGFEAILSISECLDVLRDCVLEFYNCGLLKEAFGMSSQGFKYAVKLGILFRVQQFLNLMLLVQGNIQSKDFTGFGLIISHNLTTLYNPYKPLRCHTPLFNCLPSPGILTPKNTNSVASKLLTEFSEIKITETPVETPKPKPFHKIDKKCECELCICYMNNYQVAMEYHVSCFQNELYNTKPIECIESITKGFSTLRERVIAEQIKPMEKKGRPRPPIVMSEAYIMSIVKWLRNLELSGKPHKKETKLASLRDSILQNAQKVASYSSIRFIGYTLALRHFARLDQLETLPDVKYTWMVPSSEAQRRAGVCQLLKNALFGKPVEQETDEKPKTESDNAAFVPHIIFKPGDKLNKALNEAQKDYYDYGHLLYREWRYPVTTFIAGYTDSKFRSAMMWSESTVMTSRSIARMISGKMTGVTFGSSSMFEAGVKRLPNDFTIVHLALDSDGNLVMIKMHAERTPIIVPVAHSTKVQKAFARMISIMDANDHTSDCFVNGTSEKNAKQFWAYRRKVDDMLKKTVAGIQNYLFQSFLPLLLPCQSLTAKGRKIALNLYNLVSSSSTLFDMNWAEELVSVSSQTSRSQWSVLIEALGELCGLLPTDIKSLKDEYPKLRKSLTATGVFNKSNPLYTFLIIPPILASFPFEVMPIFDNRPHVGRLVSMHALLMLLRKTAKVPQPVVVSNSYYVLDPDNNLDSTQVRLSEYISKHAWTGIVGKAPSVKEFQTVLEEKDMFFYLGHGSGSKHFSRRTIQEAACKAVAVLMGCGSVAMDYEGWGLDGKCTAYHYTIAKCPAVLGCLWMVTDGEIDRYFMALIDLVFSTDANTTVDEGAPRLRVLLDGMQKARHRVKLPFLTGASVVSFGLPIVSSE